MSEKSILDNVPVDDKAFPLNKSSPGKFIPKKYLAIVSDCPNCGAPIYGDKQVAQGDSPMIQYSCSCNNKTLQDTMRAT